MQHFIGCPPPFPQVVKGSASGSKLDSIFIQDVSILDGTLMAPLTPFTKIWRLKNNGNTVWPRGTQLLWIGGDRFSETLSVELEVLICVVDLLFKFPSSTHLIAPVFNQATVLSECSCQLMVVQ